MSAEPSEIEATILRLLTEAGDGKTISPTDVALVFEPGANWHLPMHPVRRAAVKLALAGQIVMEGFLDIRLPPYLRRLLTRAIAIVPAAIVTVWYGESGTAKLLIFSQAAHLSQAAGRAGTSTRPWPSSSKS